MKIDSIRFETKAILTTEALKQMSAANGHNKYFQHGRDYSCYRYQVNGDHRLPYIRYTVENSSLKITVPSLSRLVKGSCMRPLTDQDQEETYAALQSCLEEIGIEAPHPSEWSVRSYDLYHDFHLGEDAAKDYMRVLPTVHIPRYKTINYNWETVMFQNKNKSHYFYLKHLKCIEKGGSAEDIRLSKGVLRYEVGFTAFEISRITKLASLKFKDVCRDHVTKDLIERYFSTVPLAGLYVSTADDMKEVLARQYGTSAAIRLLGFIFAYERRALDGMDTRTVQRNLHQLREAGLAPAFGTRRLEPLRLPFTTQSQVPSPFSAQVNSVPVFKRGPLGQLIPVKEDPHFKVMMERFSRDIENL